MATPNDPAIQISDLELSLAPLGDRLGLMLRLVQPGAATDLRRGPFDVTIDEDTLRQLMLDPERYGRALTDQLFADPAALTAFAEARAASLDAGGGLRVRLLLPAALQGLRWETLLDPRSGRPLAREGDLLLTRYLSADDYQPVTLRPRSSLRALVAVAAPRDLERFKLAPVDAPAEIARIRSALSGIAVDACGSADDYCTLSGLGERLRAGEGYDILYLVAHGAFVNGAPRLYLAQNDGAVSVEDGGKLADLLRGLGARRPRLVVLASCASAGDGYADALATLGPLLAQAGVPAVLAMQGNVGVVTIEHFGPVFFRELLRDGLADRALAAARLAACDQADWWAPVLYTRLRGGRIWALPESSAAVPPGLASPYRSLDAFTIDDAALFFGRDALIEEGCQRWAASDRRFLAVVGASGSGKSSLAQAGLLPRFQHELAELHYAPVRIILKPGEQPLRALRDALRRCGMSPPADFAERLGAEPALLLEALRQPQEGGDRVSLLLIDQFEELFTLCRDESARRAFVAALAHAVQQGGGTVSVLLTLRSDFYRHCADLELRELIATYQVHVRNLHPDEMQQAITAPVRAVAGGGPPHFEAGLVELMIEETGPSPGALPLLAFTLSKLWEAGRLDLATYQKLEGVRGALERQAEQLYTSLAPNEQRATRQLLLQLVQLGEGNEDTRRRVALAELTPAWRAPEQTQDLVQRLSAARLVSTADESAPVVEVSHEALIRGWDRLRGWLDEDRAIVRLQRQIGDAARLWGASGQDVSHLWTGARLAGAAERGAALAERLTNDEQAFLEASRVEQQRQTARQQRGRIVAGVAILAVTAVVALGSLATIIWGQRQTIAGERDTAQQAQQTAVVAQAAAETAQTQVEQLQRETLSRRLATESQLLTRTGSRDLALILAIQSLRSAETYEADQALRTWLDDPARIEYIFRHDGAVLDASWNADQSRILTRSDDGTAKLWDATSGALAAGLQHDGSVSGASWNAHGTRVLSWSEDGMAKLWDGASGALIATVRHEGGVRDTRWNTHGTRFLTWGEDGTAKLIETASGTTLATFSHKGRVLNAEWNADESRILTRDDDGTAKLWSATDGALLASFDHGDVVALALLNADESRILTGTIYGTAKLWDVASGDLIATLPHDTGLRGVEWNPDGSRILSSSWYTAMLWDGTSGALLATFSNYSDLWAAQLSPDGSRILTNSDDGPQLWDGDSGALVATLPFSNVTTIAWNADGSRLLVGDANGSVSLWDVAGKSLIADLPHDGKLSDARWNADESRILTSSWNGTAKLWDATDGVLLHTFRHDGTIWSAQWNADESRILTYGEDGSARIWDASSGNLIARLAHDGPVRLAQWSADESRILTYSDDGSARIWTLDGPILPLVFKHNDRVKVAEWSADESRILIWSEAGTAKLWDAASGTPLATLEHAGALLSARQNADRSRILTSGGEGQTKLWDAADGTLIASLPHKGVLGSQWNAAGSRILTWSIDGTIKTWDASDGHGLVTLHRDSYGLAGVSWSPDERRLLTWNADGTAKLWDMAGDTPLATMADASEPWAMEWSATGDRLLTYSETGAANLWNAADGSLIATLQEDGVYVTSWSSSGDRLLTAGADNTAEVWDTASGTLLHTLQHDDQVDQLQWSPDGSRILTASWDTTAKIWDAASGALLATLPHFGAVATAEWSVDGSRILTTNSLPTGTWDHTVKLWDGTSGALIATLSHRGIVFGAAWNGDGSRILTWSDDETVKLWSADGDLLASLNQKGLVYGATWNADESRILTWGEDGTAKIHNAHTGDLLDPACGAAARNFTLAEWRSYMGAQPYRRSCANVPLHLSYREDVVTRLKGGQLSEADAIVEVGRALQVDPSGEPPAELMEEARAIVGELLRAEG